MNRRKFCGVVAGAVAMVVGVYHARQLMARPAVGTVFYFFSWVPGEPNPAVSLAYSAGYTMLGQGVFIDSAEVIEANIDGPVVSAEDALDAAADGEAWAFRQVEKDRGVRLGRVLHVVSYHADRGAWAVISQASVVA